MVNKKQAKEYAEVFHTAILILLQRLGNPLCNVSPAIKHLLTIIRRSRKTGVLAPAQMKFLEKAEFNIYGISPNTKALHVRGFLLCEIGVALIQ